MEMPSERSTFSTFVMIFMLVCYHVYWLDFQDKIDWITLMICGCIVIMFVITATRCDLRDAGQRQNLLCASLSPIYYKFCAACLRTCFQLTFSCDNYVCVHTIHNKII